MKRWKKLEDLQLVGASYAYRILLTSPALVGASREIVQDLATEVLDELNRRNTEFKKKRSVKA